MFIERPTFWSLYLSHTAMLLGDKINDNTTISTMIF